jgi:arylsulfatase
MASTSRREFIKSMACGAAAASLAGSGCIQPAANAGNPDSDDARPNIIYILADDLGYSEVGCYGQQKIKTPHIDKLAAAGMRFTQHYSGSAVCAPTRCMLLTGKHSGHAYIRGNDEMGDRGDVWNDPELEGQRPLKEGTETLGRMLQRRGYKTACIGKWGLGWYGSSGDPNQQGFDHYFGYICQRVAHNYYPTHLWKDGKKVMLDNPPFKAHQKLPADADPMDPKSYEAYHGKDYAPDFLVQDAVEFIRENRDGPFFLYFCTPVPHVSLQVPEDSLEAYLGAFPETPYWGEKSYLPHRAPRAAYAAMVTRMDRDIGKLVTELKRLKIYDNTVIMFSSDNGPTFNGGTDSEFFESNGALNGLKCSLLEGGIRVPMIACWPGHIRPGSITDHVSAQWDVMATMADLTGAQAPADSDGISFLATLTGAGRQEKHEYLYWEYAGQQAVRLGDWKGYRRNAKKFPDEPIRLYHLGKDPAETTDVAGNRPEILKRMVAIMNARVPSEFDRWNFSKIKNF